MVQPLVLAVPEAASCPATIQFKITVSTTNGNPLPFNVTTPLFRSFQQVNWLHRRLSQTFTDLAIPPLPDPPNANHVEDQDYVEQKRMQVHRFLAKVGRRTELVSDKDVRYFLSSDMSHTDAVDPRKSPVLGFLNIITPNYERGLKIYRPSETVKDNDQDEFQRRQTYILTLESHFINMFDHLKAVVKQREILGDDLSVLGDSATEALSGGYVLGAGVKIDNTERHRVLDTRVQMFGRVMDEMSFVMQRQVSLGEMKRVRWWGLGKGEIYYLGDVFQEYKGMTDSIKGVMNLRTERLGDCVNVIKQRNRKRDKTDRLKLKMAQNSADVLTAITEEEQATESVTAVQEAFTAAQQSVARELSWFEEERSRDLSKALRDYVQVTVRYERQKLETLQRALRRMREVEVGPDAHPRLLENPPKRTSSLPIGDAGPWPDEEQGDSEATSVRSAPEVMLASVFAVSPFTRLETEVGGWGARGRKAEVYSIEPLGVGLR
ncbi:hypothetical protein BC938DRAFT_470808 [Jimgerdemannia flammicorona]|uniref:PX domain-containing protein n=1 Tax=Jimgerdemannia flammicorona TaxID=994334 RepID=A0A433Q9G5_9FUNG|nr:hypothetical protein BC938DRAFT_470808 [Jimgerdemannia flammicorona]